MKDYKIVDDVVSFEHGPYRGLSIRYGRVELIPEPDHLRLAFEYDVVGGDVSMYNLDPLHRYLGEVLHEMIEEQRASRQLVYYGGVDEDRK